jgi:nitrate reductase NapD
MDSICISSLVVQAAPALRDRVRATLDGLPDTEVLAEGDTGKFVVILDSPDNRAAADRVSEIQNVAGVLSATLVYQYDDQLDARMEESE